VDFTEGEGVKRLDNEVRIYKGPDSCDRFFDDLLQTAKEHDDDVNCFIKSQDVLLQSCGLNNSKNLARLERLNQATRIKCLVSETPTLPLPLPSLQVRTLSGPWITPISYYVFGNKHAYVMNDEPRSFQFVVFQTIQRSQDYRAHFHALWDHALPCKI